MAEIKKERRISFEEDFKRWSSWNCSALLLMQPVTSLGIGDFSKHGFINSYLKDAENKYHNDNVLFVLLKADDVVAMNRFIENEKETSAFFIEDYDYNEYTILVYTIREKYKEDFEKFKRGEYSKFSKEFKQSYPRTVRGTLSSPTFQYMVMYKDDKLRKELEGFLGVKFDDEQELWSVPNLERETLVWSNIIQKGEKEEIGY